MNNDLIDKAYDLGKEWAKSSAIGDLEATQREWRAWCKRHLLKSPPTCYFLFYMELSNCPAFRKRGFGIDEVDAFARGAFTQLKAAKRATSGGKPVKTTSRSSARHTPLEEQLAHLRLLHPDIWGTEP